jgi:hypothetical protein
MKGLDELFTSLHSAGEVCNNRGNQRAVKDSIRGNHSRRRDQVRLPGHGSQCQVTGAAQRASAGSAICTSACCKKEYHEERQRQNPGALAMVPAATSRQTEVMPAGLEVHEVAEIMGERCCTL